jgi:predicted permease
MNHVLTRARLWLRSLFLRRRLEAEMQHEMAAHLDQATDRLVARGLSPTEARAAAIREFGNMTYLKEEGRRARGTRWVEALAADSRFAIRHFRRNPGATLTILIVLAIGMSISTALFSFMHAYATQPPLGVPVSDDLVRIRGRQLTTSNVRLRRLSLEELQEYQGLTSHFAAVAGYVDNGVTIAVDSDPGRAESGAATFVTPNYFDVLDVRPVIGVGLPRADTAQAEPQLIAVVSYDVWARFFARSPSAIGATLTVDGVRVTIVGVAPPRFAGLREEPHVSYVAPVSGEMKVWMPIASRPLVVPGRLQPGIRTFGAVARLAPGTDAQRATAAVQVIAERGTAAIERTQAPRAQRRIGADVVPLLATNGSPQDDDEAFGMSVVAAVLGTLILLVTCTNVSALQTGLALVRRREIAIRLSMGASRRRIVRQLLTETIILATLAGAAALGLVWLIRRVLVTRLPGLPVEIAVNGPALAFVFGLALVVGTVFGLSPALHATRITVSSALKDSTAALAAPRVRLQRGLVVAQIALTQPLIVALGITVLTVWEEYRGLGLNESAEQIVSMRLRPAAVQQQDSAPPQWAGEIRALRDRLLSTPSIEAAVQDLRRTLGLGTYTVHPDDRIGTASDRLPVLSAPMVAPGYFGVMGMRLMLGRDFAESDQTPPQEQRRVEVPVVIGSDLASALWGAANPLRRRLQPAVDSESDLPTLTVVGVVEQPRDRSGSATSDGYRVFLPPASAVAASSLSMLIRTSGDARSLIPTIRGVVEQGTSRLAIADTRTIADLELETRDMFTLAAKALGTAGFLILFLAAVGLFAVVSFAVGQRTSEIAVRMAVGARGGQIVGKFMGEGVRLGIIGFALGLPLSLMAKPIMPTAGPAEMPIGGIAVAAGIVVLAVALAATWVPARRAAGVDPARVLRRD